MEICRLCVRVFIGFELLPGNQLRLQKITGPSHKTVCYINSRKIRLQF